MEQQKKRELIEKKHKEARAVLARCIGKKGIWASPYRYKDTCWTRDLAFSIPALVREGYHKEVRGHLEELIRRQKPDGKIPFCFLDNVPRWLWRTTRESIKRRHVSLVLLKLFSKDGIVAMSPWTRDSELLFIKAMRDYAVEADDIAFFAENIDSGFRAFAYINQNLMRDGLIVGADWRDSRPELDGKTLLSMNSLFADISPESEKVSRRILYQLKNKINTLFWVEDGYYRDYPGTDELDILGNTFAILCGIAPKDRAVQALRRFSLDDSPYGYVMRKAPLPPIAPGEDKIMEQVNTRGLVYPLLTAFTVLAAHSIGEVSIAEQGFEKLLSLEGMYEWYDPATGRSGGSPDQLWTAALFLDAAYALGYIN